MGPFRVEAGGVVNFQLKAGVSPTISLYAVRPELIPGAFQQKVKNVVSEGGVLGDPQVIGKKEEHLAPLNG